MSEKFPRIDYGQTGPDDGGYGEAVDSGDPGDFAAILGSVTHASMGDIPPSHVHEDTRDNDQKEYLKNNESTSGEITKEETTISLDDTPEETSKEQATSEKISEKPTVAASNPIGSPANKKDLMENGKDDEIVDEQIETLSHMKEIPKIFLDFAEDIIRAKTYEDLSEDFDVYIQKANEIKENYDENLGKKLEEKLELLSEDIYA